VCRILLGRASGTCLFAQAPETLPATSTESAAPALAMDRLYELKLARQSEVHFAAPPGRPSPSDGSYGTLLHLRVPQPGTYRIALDSKVWVDVLADGAALAAGDFTGRPGCSAPHKIVEFVLPAGKTLILQLSGATTATVRLSVTRAPERAS
jgi:hypothetical protein